jgi:ribosomal protein S27E
MGDGYYFKCEDCGATERVLFGAGMSAIVEPCACPICGKIVTRSYKARGETQFVGQNPVCPDHPEAELVAIHPESRIMCPECGSGWRQADASSGQIDWD